MTTMTQVTTTTTLASTTTRTARAPPTALRRVQRKETAMRIDRKRALRIGGRAAGFVAAAALAVATVAAAALVPWPEHRAEAPSVVVSPRRRASCALPRAR